MQLKNLLPLNAYGKILEVRISIDKGTRERMDKIITGEYDEQNRK